MTSRSKSPLLVRFTRWRKFTMTQLLQRRNADHGGRADEASFLSSVILSSRFFVVPSFFFLSLFLLLVLVLFLFLFLFFFYLYFYQYTSTSFISTSTSFTSISFVNIPWERNRKKEEIGKSSQGRKVRSGTMMLLGGWDWYIKAWRHADATDVTISSRRSDGERRSRARLILERSALYRSNFKRNVGVRGTQSGRSWGPSYLARCWRAVTYGGIARRLAIRRIKK